MRSGQSSGPLANNCGAQKVCFVFLLLSFSPSPTALILCSLAPFVLPATKVSFALSFLCPSVGQSARPGVVYTKLTAVVNEIFNFI